jgi:enoyl-CoA hydratase
MNLVLVEKHDGFAIVTLNRPEAKNALSRKLREELVAAFTRCAQDDEIQVIILTGQGNAFCAGFDLKELSQANSSVAQEADNSVARAMESFEGPIIGAVNGHAITGGFELALACDMLIASEEARFADTHARVGILPGWGLSQKLPRLIGMSRAKEISFTGRPILAQEALHWGLVNHVVPPTELLPKAIQLAEEMCACQPHILREYKQLIEQGVSMPYREALAWEEKQSIQSAKKASAAMMEKRRDAVLKKGQRE